MIKVTDKRAIAIALSIMFASCSNTKSIAPVSINQQIGPSTELTLEISGIKNEQGSILVYIHDNRDSYYSDDNIFTDSISFFIKKKIKAVSSKMTIVFDDIPAGRYAITSHHDEDDDGRLDRMFIPIGMPSEPYGSTNGSVAFLSKGSFEEALIEVKGPKTSVAIKLSTHLEWIL
jgi:uncharacterized protein (DUF2141 family)